MFLFKFQEKKMVLLR